MTAAKKDEPTIPASYLTPQQVTQLLAPIKPSRVAVLDGLSHLEAYDVRAHLNRCFGFGRWSADVLDVTQLYETPTETKNKKPAFSVAYRVTLRLSVSAPDGTHLATYTEAAVGGSTMPDYKRADCHDMAVKTAESQALKRCATNLGDQFGLSLYRKGSKDALVVGTLVGLPPQAEADKQESVDANAPDVLPEQQPTEPAEPTRLTPAPQTPAGGEPTSPPAEPDQKQAQALADLTMHMDSVSGLKTAVYDPAKERSLLGAVVTDPVSGQQQQLHELIATTKRALEQRAAAA